MRRVIDAMRMGMLRSSWWVEDHCRPARQVLPIDLCGFALAAVNFCCRKTDCRRCLLLAASCRPRLHCDALKRRRGLAPREWGDVILATRVGRPLPGTDGLTAEGARAGGCCAP